MKKKPTKKTIETTIKKYESINSIILVDLYNEKEIARAGKIGDEDVDVDLYIDDGKIMVLYFVPNFRFSELVMNEEDEKKILYVLVVIKRKKLKELFHHFHIQVIFQQIHLNHLV